MIHEARLYTKLSKNNVICKTCARQCIIRPTQLGFCKGRTNHNGILYHLNYGIVSSHNIDPIEKKPLKKFLPGTYTYSIGGWGCNMECANCQNHTISQPIPDNSTKTRLNPEYIVDTAIKTYCPSIAWTYNEPTIALEYALDTSKLAHENDIKTIYISNGYMTPEALKLLLKDIDAFNIDLKFMDQLTYQNITHADLQPILNNLKTIADSDKHLEISNLLIPEINDSEEDIKKLVTFVYDELGDIPLHFLQFRPMHKMYDHVPMDNKGLGKARTIAREYGLTNVY